MKSFQFTVTDPLGIHARPAGMLVKLCGTFTSRVTVTAPGGSADGKRLIQWLRLAVKQGTELTIQLDGPDEDRAAEELETFLHSNL